MLTNLIHNILLALELMVPLLTQPGHLLEMFLTSPLVRFAVVVLVINLGIAIVGYFRENQSRPVPTAT